MSGPCGAADDGGDFSKHVDSVGAECFPVMQPRVCPGDPVPPKSKAGTPSQGCCDRPELEGGPPEDS